MDNRVTVACALVLVAAVCWLGYADLLKKFPPPDYCPEGNWAQERSDIRSPGRTAIIIDTSDRITVDDRERFEARLDTLTRSDGVPFLQRLAVYGLPEEYPIGDEDVQGSFCLPKEGSDANPWYDNRQFIEARFKAFLLRVDSIVAKLVDRKEAEQSPLLETMAGLVQQNDDLDSFVVLSDMLQNTEVWSHYSRRGDITEVQRTCDLITMPTRIHTVYVYYIDRQRPSIQHETWPDDWWERCLDGVELRMLNAPG